MSTNNFITMEHFPLVIGGIYDEDAIRRDFEEMGEPFDEMILQDYFELDYYDAENLAASFAENLKYHTVKIRAGYYEGFQFYVEPLEDFDPRSPWCIDNETAWYEFDCCRSRALRDAARERRKICRWLCTVAADNGYDLIRRVACFNNGAALYDYDTAENWK